MGGGLSAVRLRDQQYAFAAHLRDPERAPAPAGIEDRRMAIYRDLFYRNVEGLLAGNFPVLRRILADTDWHRLVRAFYREHRARTPLFPEIGREFLRYLEARQQRSECDAALDLPFVVELAHYEWVELALSLDDTELADIPQDRDGDLLAGVPLPSPLAWPLAYRWPVHRLAPSFQPAEPPAQPTFLLVVRDRSDAVRFKEINPLTFQLLQRLHANDGLTGGALLAGWAEELGQPREAFVRNGATVLAQLRSGDAILGTAPAQQPPAADTVAP